MDFNKDLSLLIDKIEEGLINAGDKYTYEYLRELKELALKVIGSEENGE